MSGGGRGGVVVELDIVTGTTIERWAPEVRAVLNAGWSGRDPALVRAHAGEMRALGIPPPTEFPIAFPIARAMLTQANTIEIYSPESSGEVEYVLVVAGKRAAITVGSDHTDRKVESLSIELSKRVCPNVMARAAWDYAEVAGHVDDLILRSWVETEGQWRLYQDAPLATLLPPEYWLGRLARVPATQGAAVVLFSGTAPTLGGALSYGEGFRVSLEDPRMGRTIAHEYRARLVANPLGIG